MQRLLPDPAPMSPAVQYSGLGLGELASDDRPYVVSNFAVTLDGRATIGGRSGPIGSKTDTEVLYHLRAEVDAVMIGAGTIRAERYGRLVPQEALRGRRERAGGLAHDPLAVIVTASLILPWDAGLFTSGTGSVLIFTSSDREVPETATTVRVERHRGDRVDLGRALATLRRERGVRALLCEGGPTLHANLLREGLVDELFLTIAPKLAGGHGPSLLESAPEAPQGLEPIWLLEEGGELFARYRLGGR